MDAYWAACARGELLVQRCLSCDRRVHLPADDCPSCAGELRFEPVSGEGTICTYTVVHRTFAEGFAVPYVLAWVDLPEGVRAFGQVVECPPERLRVGLPVRVTFLDDLPHWRPT
ncbi:Zn-ribbon domain-containing OB-fold protein [Nonomuraea sp. NPDC050328]|uniref:Zn-ribbon domain-containing OB-fold protein n=1 Tax=Nonomuraea sp. NPDC050328 TaxID=3364361 RepID=UPI0037B30EAF